MLHFEQQKHWVFLYWLVFIGFLFFFLVFASNEGFLLQIFMADKSKIVFLIALLYLFGTFKAGMRAKTLSEEIDRIRSLDIDSKSDAGNVLDSANYAFSIVFENSKIFNQQFTMNTSNQKYFSGKNDPNYLFILVEKCKGPHDSGWFLSESILKLGLLGTIIGFILMLAPVTEITTFDVNTMQEILGKMSVGMGTALYTTLAGILGSATIGYQNLILDKGADCLISEILWLKDKASGSESL